MFYRRLSLIETFRVARLNNFEHKSKRMQGVVYPGILFWGGGFNKFSGGQRERGSGDGSPLVRGVLEAAIIWYKKFHFT